MAVGKDVASCPGSPTSASITDTTTFGHNWSWSSADAGAKFLSVIQQSTNILESTKLDSSDTGRILQGVADVAEGSIGHLAFKPLMYRSEGTMTWNEYMYDEFNTVSSYESAVTSETPVDFDGKAFGDFVLEERAMDSNELLDFCGIANP